MDDLQRSVLDLQDREQIRSILYTYVDRVDAGDIGAVTNLFTADIRYDFMGTERVGRDRVGQRIRRALAQFDRTSHHVSNLLVTVDGDRASQSASLYAYHRYRESGAAWHFWGRYQQSLIRIDGGWQVSAMGLAGIDGDPVSSPQEQALYRGHPDRRSIQI